MVVAVSVLELHIPAGRSLKAKRKEVNGLTERIRDHVEEVPGAMVTAWEPFFVEEAP